MMNKLLPIAITQKTFTLQIVSYADAEGVTPFCPLVRAKGERVVNRNKQFHTSNVIFADALPLLPR